MVNKFQSVELILAALAPAHPSLCSAFQLRPLSVLFHALVRLQIAYETWGHLVRRGDPLSLASQYAL